MSVELTIVDTQPCAVYQGVVYDRDVTVEFTDGTKIGAFDPNATTSEAIIGNDVRAELSLLVRSLNVVAEQTPRVDPNSEEPLGWRSHDFCGRVVERNPPSEVSLDIGVGVINFSLDSETWQGLNNGSFVHVKAGRVDVFVETE